MRRYFLMSVELAVCLVPATSHAQDTTEPTTLASWLAALSMDPDVDPMVTEPDVDPMATDTGY